MEIDTTILIPAAVLILWTMGVAITMAIARAKMFSALKIDMAKAPPGARGADIANEYPDVRDWAAHNYMHLLEQPTVFYAASVLLALGGATGYDFGLCILYVVLRMVHSVWQIRYNLVPVRALIFGASSLVMLLIAVRALLAVL